NEAAAQPSTPLSTEWWSAFDSAELKALVDAALAGSPDLAIATERVRQAEAQVRIAGATLFPVLNLGAGTSRRVTDREGQPSQRSDASNITFSASYEVDLFGRNAAGVRAADASYRASGFDRDAARLTLIAGVATSYFEVLSLRGRLAIARENLAIAERVLSLVEVRARNGAASQLDVERQHAQVLSQRAALLPLEQLEKQTLAALAVLIGRVPEGFGVKAASLADLRIPEVNPGLPAELLVRRPDLAAAEAQVAAANGNVAAARAALLPSIELTGSAGLTSAALLTFLSGPQSAVSLALSLFQPIFDGGRLRGQVAVSESRERELAEAYRKAILSAFSDVEQALVAVSRSAQREAIQVEAQQRARNALRLAEIRYREGADDLLTVLEAQRTLFQAEDQLASIRFDRLSATVALYKALGGGWSAESATLAQRT
ncbi:MAG TPA: efflux transporter outer membrane subunit, partial [Burkholderiales bacterium]|nr:efflux transporter outer membrane subunit [Burkholderiales bacterium]